MKVISPYSLLPDRDANDFSLVEKRTSKVMIY